MNELTVRFKIKAKKRKPEKNPDVPSPVEKSGTPPVSRAARMLALAHYVERLVEQGSVKSYADAARQLSVTRARMTQVLNLLDVLQCMGDDITEDDLIGRAGESERDRAVAYFAIGMRQLAEGRRLEAKESFEKSAASPVYYWSDPTWARAFVARMEKDPTWPDWLPAEPVEAEAK